MRSNKSFATTQADRCLPLLVALAVLGAFAPAQAQDMPSIPEAITVPGWWVVGPFLSGVREAATDPLAYYEGAAPFSEPLLKPGFPSTLVPGGMARWRYYASGEDGSIEVDYPEVPEAAMELVTDEWGFAGAMTEGCAYATLVIEDGPRRALIDLQHAGGLRLNGLPYPGDPYGHKMALTPVVFRDGPNELRIGVGSRQRFSLRILPATEDVLALTKSATLPDLVRGAAPPSLIALPLVNTTERWVTVDEASLGESDLFARAEATCDVIPPLGLVNCVLKLTPAVDAIPMDLEGEEYVLPVQISYEDGELPVELKLRLREPDQSRRVTFRSAMDGSVQYYGLLLPTDFDPGQDYGLILSLHGAGVEASGQVDAYQPKDWAFVVAPTNRRRFGFDWQDWGRLDMLEVLGDVMARYPIDGDRVHLAGHSMGGHGTWYNAFTYPDLWATASPSAGWTTFELYVPMFLRRNVTVGAPRANLLWNLALREDNTLVLAENALNLPIYALEGGADDNVPPQQPRMLVEELTRYGYGVTYEEVPEMGHWWSDPDTPFTDCVDNERHNLLWESTTRERWPAQVVFRTHNYSVSNRAYWVQVLAPMRAYDDIVVRAEVTGTREVEVRTTNVKALALMLARELIPAGAVSLCIDGDALQVREDSGELVQLVRENGHWQAGGYRHSLPYKTPATYGPWKQALMRPFVVIYGTTGTEEQTALSLQLARLYAFHWWYRSNGRTEIMADVDLPLESLDRNLVVIGGPECNALARAIVPETPLRPAQGGVIVGERLVHGADLTYKLVYPNPLNGGETLVLLEGGTSLEAMKRLSSMIAIYSGGGFPDWLVWQDEYKLRGLGGAVAAGFFGMEWEVDETLSYFNEDLIARLD